MSSYEASEIIGNISAVTVRNELGSGAPYARIGVGVSVYESGETFTRWYSVILRGSTYDYTELEQKFPKGKMILVKGKPRFKVKIPKDGPSEPSIEFTIFPTEPPRVLG